jgi:hypothetical protein
MATLQALEAERARLLAERDILAARYQSGDTSVLPQIEVINVKLRNVILEMEALATPTGSTAAGEIVSNAPLGYTQNPPLPPSGVGRLTTTEAATLAQNTEFGTDPPVKTLITTQSVDNTAGLPVYSQDGTLLNTRQNPETGELYTPVPEGRPGGAPGVGAKGEDGATATNTKQIINAVSQQPFQPRNNVLDQYASYTYNIGWYLMTPEQYIALTKTKKIALGQYNLLIQSGGAPSTVEGVQPDLTSSGAVASVSQTAGRNPFFGLDYYLDDLEIKSVVTGSGTNSPHNAAEIKFTVTEPANITLINNLWEAVKAVYKESTIPISAAYYALVIRFYGYDENGKIVQASDSDNKNAIVEKIIPFKLNDIQFTVSNKLVEYHVTATPDPYLSGFGTSSGVIKSNIEITGATVKDLVSKGSSPAAVSPADGRTSAPAAGNTPSPSPSPSPDSSDGGKLETTPGSTQPFRLEITGTGDS